MYTSGRVEAILFKTQSAVNRSKQVLVQSDEIIQKVRSSLSGNTFEQEPAWSGVPSDAAAKVVARRSMG